jgi:excisionase family DNA binding protein
MKKLLKAAEIAEYLSVTLSTIRKWTHYKFIPHVKIGRVVRYDLSVIDEWLDSKASSGRKRIRIPSTV